MTTQVLLLNVLGSGWPRIVRTCRFAHLQHYCIMDLPILYIMQGYTSLSYVNKGIAAPERQHTTFQILQFIPTIML